LVYFFLKGLPLRLHKEIMRAQARSGIAAAPVFVLPKLLFVTEKLA
jgi:hypothetical protein